MPKVARYIPAFVWYGLYVGLAFVLTPTPRASLTSFIVAFVGFAFLFYLAGEES